MPKNLLTKELKKKSRMHSYKKKFDSRRNLLKQNKISTKSTKKSKGISKLTNRELNQIKNQHDRQGSPIISSRLILIFQPAILTNLM